MTDLLEASVWEDGIYQLELTDPVLGGVPNAGTGEGIDNVPTQQLANRTLFLKTAIEVLQVSLGSLNFATQGDINAAINAVVNTSPDTLDTLNELAAALGDDPNFATTMTALIGTKLGTNAFTGAAILALLLSVDGVGSGLDADKLDGNEATAFATAAQGIKADAALSAANVLDEDTFATNSPTKPPSQQSTKVYIAAELSTAIASLVAASPGTLDTLNELAAALGDDPNFATTMTALIGTKLGTNAFTGAAILALLLSVDGVGSGLDADKLDGKHASEFALVGDADSWGYSPPAITLTSRSTTTFIHNLAAEPTKFSLDIVCIAPDLGYPIGEKIVGFSSTPNAAFDQGFTYIIPSNNVTQLKLIMGAAIVVINSSGNEQGIDMTKWKFLVKASL